MTNRPAPASSAMGPPDPVAQRVRMLHMAAAGLGAYSLLVAFLPFYTTGNNGISGYALGTPTSAAIGFSIFAGLLSSAELVAGGTGPADVPQPLGFAAALTALLLGIANLIARGSLSGDLSFGFVIFLLGLLVQNAVLGYLWLLGTGRLSNATGATASRQPQTHAAPYALPPQPSTAEPLYGPFYPPPYPLPYPTGPAQDAGQRPAPYFGPYPDQPRSSNPPR